MTDSLEPVGMLTEAAETHVENVIDLYRRHVNPGLARLMQFGGFGDVEISAQGCEITTATGATFLDFVGGFGVFSLGHRHPRVVEAVHRQLDRMPLSTRTFFSEPQTRLAARLAALAPGNLDFAFFSNSGTEAVEAALKFARIATGRMEFVSTEGSYHGKTMGALAVTGREKYRVPFAPMVPGTTFVPFNDLDAMANAVSSRTAAVIIEPIQGEGGIHVAQDGYLTGLRRLCDRHGALLIADEVQTGIGRTGAMFAVDHENVVPDLLTLAKALGGGVMPIGATLMTPAISQAVFGKNPLIHTSTFGGNPLAMAAGLAALQAVEDEGLMQNAVLRGEQLMSGLHEIQTAFPDVITAVRGRGLMVGVEFSVKDYAELTIAYLAKYGIIAAYTLNNPQVIRMEPPLIVTSAQVETVIGAFCKSVGEAVAALVGLED